MLTMPAMPSMPHSGWPRADTASRRGSTFGWRVFSAAGFIALTPARMTIMVVWHLALQLLLQSLPMNRWCSDPTQEQTHVRHSGIPVKDQQLLVAISRSTCMPNLPGRLCCNRHKYLTRQDEILRKLFAKEGLHSMHVFSSERRSPAVKM